VKIGKICAKHPELNGLRHNNRCAICRDEYTKTYNRRYIIENKHRLSAARKKYYIDNKQRIKALNKEWKLKNKDKLKILAKEYRNKNKIKINISKFRCYEYYRDSLADNYVKGSLRQEGVSDKNITPALIEIKRLFLKTNRLLKQEKQNEKR
jgi:hypothetical protein